MKVEPRSPHFQDLPDAIKRALAIEPDRRSGTIRDVDHVVILMQENRSFDHYFGTLPGVRLRRSASRAHARRRRSDAGRRRHPHRPLCLAARASQRHAGGLHHAAHLGRRPARLERRPHGPVATRQGRLGMGAYGPAELPFQTALADAFTLCEAYHCSMQAGTNPNRLFLWTGANDPRGEAGGPALVTPMTASAPPPRAMPGPPIPNGCSRPAWTGASIRTWPTTSTTTPGRLSPIPRGACLGVTRAARARPVDPHAARPGARRRRRQPAPGLVDHRARRRLRASGSLVAARRRRTRNGCWTSSRATRRSGAAASSSSPTTRTTALRPRAAAGPTRAQRRRAIGRPVHRGAGRRVPRRAHRPQRRHARRPAALHGRAFGMGPRVPMLVVSPWSRGGWVNAQVFDHTSVIRFWKPAMASWNPTSAPGAAPSPAT